ncbi:16S rRNA (cytosine(967)-C(5))-methyltransferase RsmB [Fusobacterium sp. IOR10]|uniref:16S rRNA (cytosine(967)-C(5))-methyltransferase RsmB n=1 Tax=Fusobacterium sp. IOR10 TaxID=2665157 RepID=UPI0013D7F00C|nr:16S rRNA (cytosine(967)-C(5))-methyltransferase RsmB [Fusobacterium sp. IOR10]
MNIKKRIISIISETEKGKYSNIALNEYFKANPLSAKERGFITEVFYGVIRNKIFLDTMIDKRVTVIKKDWLRQLLRISIYQITFMDSDEAGVVWEGAELAKRKFSNPLGKFVNGVLRSYLRDKEKEIENLRDEHKLNILYSYPKWFYKKMESEYGKDCENVLKSLKKIPYLSVRVNTLKYSTEEFEKLLEAEHINIMKKIDTVYYIDSGIVIYFKEFKEGKIIAQDGSSYLAVKLLDPKPGERVLDTCSAPGSKTVLIGELMKNQGEILALDIYPHKLKLIENNAKKMGIDIITAVKMDAVKVKEQGKKFDKILVDAPCSGYGVIRKKPEALYNKDMNNVNELSALQYNILDSASKVLKDDGELVYSTCTITKEENTDNIAKFLENNPDFESVKVEIPSNVKGEYDDFNGFLINYKEEVLDNFYIIKLRKKKN